MRVLLILVDGMRSDALAQIPQAQTLLNKASYTMQAQTVTPSVTLPAHMSLFHSVDPSRHGITTNLYVPQARPINGLCEVLNKNGKWCAMFHGWDELRDVARPGSMIFSFFCSGRPIGREAMNNNVANACIEYIKHNQTDFIFLYFGYTDYAGHKDGWMSPGYMEAMRNSWENIEKVLNSLPEDYTVLITADHGGHDRTHGSELPEDMTIPFFGIGKDFLPGKELEKVSIKDIAPTVTKLLGVAPDDEWEGTSLL